MGIEPGRIWAVAVDRPLAFPKPDNPSKSFKWNNHVAPSVMVEGVELSVLVIDPSTQTGPVALTHWAASMGARVIEVSDRGLSQADILSRQSARALRGQGLDAVLFNLRLGEPPIPEKGGSGFCIGADPAAELSRFARAVMQRLLGK
jgi:hypothetical protein